MDEPLSLKTIQCDSSVRKYKCDCFKSGQVPPHSFTARCSVRHCLHLIKRHQAAICVPRKKLRFLPCKVNVVVRTGKCRNRGADCHLQAFQVQCYICQIYTSADNTTQIAERGQAMKLEEFLTQTPIFCILFFQKLVSLPLG